MRFFFNSVEKQEESEKLDEEMQKTRRMDEMREEDKEKLIERTEESIQIEF
jgi:hypothetical protein